MKIVLLNGQNHKGSTYHIGRMIADKIEGEHAITEFFLPRDLNHFCTGCYACIEDRDACPYAEEKNVILEAIDEADLLILTTPTYCMHISAPLKSFFELTFDYWMSHRPMESMFKKRAVIVSTSAGSTTRKTLADVKDALFYMGVPSITKMGIAVQAKSWDEIKPERMAIIEKKTSAIAQKLHKPTVPHVGIKLKATFAMMAMIHKKGWNSSPIETEYWQEKGWLGKKRPWN